MPLCELGALLLATDAGLAQFALTDPDVVPGDCTDTWSSCYKAPRLMGGTSGSGADIARRSNVGRIDGRDSWVAGSRRVRRFASLVTMRSRSVR